ncbi:hypothetical protein MAR_031141 [Mya arenaria]|uniref:Uncharacterized protein n=1 Tax=Mya arenaria TaxID=6604 RepID=A0ABY7F4K6_MYAAR|nr:hypothetical protein MAR_031141 [Mya arenaria]
MKDKEVSGAAPCPGRGGCRLCVPQTCEAPCVVGVYLWNRRRSTPPERRIYIGSSTISALSALSLLDAICGTDEYINQQEDIKKN